MIFYHSFVLFHLNVLPFLIIHNNNNKVYKINKIGFERNYKGDIKFDLIEDYKNTIIQEKKLPYNLGIDFDEILEPFKKSDNKAVQPGLLK